jgi:hypothetical protein
VHVEPLGLYSRKIKTLAELADGADVALPNDPSNTGRALLLLQAAKLITLKDPGQSGLDLEGHRDEPEESEVPRTRSGDPAARARPGRRWR